MEVLYKTKPKSNTKRVRDQDGTRDNVSNHESSNDEDDLNQERDFSSSSSTFVNHTNNSQNVSSNQNLLGHQQNSFRNQIVVIDDGATTIRSMTSRSKKNRT
jgi:hypothetical protein